MAPLSPGARADSYMQPPPDHFVVTPGGVDMRSGRYTYSHTDLSIGGDAGLQLTRSNKQDYGLNPFGYLSDNFDIVAVGRRVNIANNDYRTGAGNDFQVEVGIGGLSDTFRSGVNDGGFAHASSTGFASLTWSGGDRISSSTVYTYQTGGGSTVVFQPMGITTFNSTVASQLIRPDGTILTFEYDSTPKRLRSVTSTRGQALVLEYSGSVVTKACVLNLARMVKPATNICPTGVPTATYTYDTLAGTQRLASVTDPSGSVWGFVNGTVVGGTSMGFVNPGEASPWLTNTLSSYPVEDRPSMDIVGSQTFADGQHYAYVFNTGPDDLNGSRIPPLAGGTYDDANGNEVNVEFDFPSVPGTGPGDQCTHFPCQPPEISTIIYQMTAGPARVTDALGRMTSTHYYSQGPRNLLPYPQLVIDPGGVQTQMTWDLQAGNMLENRQISKTPGTPADLVKTATYNCGLATFRYCSKPLSVTDAKGYTTNFTYDPAHGGVLTEMRPAPSSGAARPLKRTTWTQKYAYITNGSTLIAAASPVWVIATDTVCQTVAGSNPSPVCDAAAPQRVTTYEYGANGTANNLFVRGQVVTAGGTSRRTCFLYDDLGNRISQTSARAGLATCP
jgi:hypothetical protein